MGSLHRLVNQEIRPAAELYEVQDHALINIDAENDIVQYCVIGPCSSECQDDDVDSQIINGKSPPIKDDNND